MGHYTSDGSQDPYGRRLLGPGWRQIFDTRLVAQSSPPQWLVINWDGNIETWTQTNGVFKPLNNEYHGELTKLPSGDYEWTTPARIVWRFRDPSQGQLMDGRLVEIHDFNGNSVHVIWNEGEGYIKQVIDTGGGRYDFGFDSVKGHYTSITFQGWTVNFGYDPANGLRLTSTGLTAPPGYTNLNATWQFYYTTNGFLERIMDPRGNTNVFVQYDRYGRRTNEVDGLGRRNSYAYGVTGRRQIAHSDPERFQWIETYDRKHRLLSEKDPLGNTTSFTYDAAGNRTSITDPLGSKLLFAYDNRANVLFVTNTLGEVRQVLYHPFFNKAVREISPQPVDVNGNTTWTNYYDLDDATGNLLRHRDDLGTLAAYSYTINGLAASKTDGNGNMTRMHYDTNGFLVTTTDAAGYTSRIGRNEWGWPTAETNALGEVTTYAYDINGKAVRRVDPLQRVFLRRFDENANLLSDYDAKGQVTRFVYDAENQRTQMVDRAGFTWSYTYTPRGQLQSVTDPLGSSTNNVYDAANRKVKVTYPMGLTSLAQYDAAGRITNAIDRAGQGWRTVYDRLGREIARIDPLADTRKTLYDTAGHVREILTPNGYPSQHAYDGRGRLKKWVDAEGFEWRYDYDSVANITNVTDALGGHYAMAYGVRNERISERNQDGFEWRYDYDELLRPKMNRDPNGTVKTFSYDTGSRLTNATFNTGRLNSFQYDANNNQVVISRSGSGSTTTAQLTYDELDRVKQYIDPFGKAVRYDYDPAGRPTSITYPDGRALIQRFDALGRMTNSVFPFSAQTNFPMSFGYDAMDRLVWRTYPNGIAQTNRFDTAGRIVGLQYGSGVQISSNQVSMALTYAYDRNGNKTSSTETGTLDWRPLLESDERASYTRSGRLVDREVANLGTNVLTTDTVTYRYDASGNLTNAVGGGQIFDLTYDEDNRVTSLRWDCGLTGMAITNRYDALGRRMSKIADGIESRYVIDVAGKMERVLCDLTSAGQISTWYVHAPDLAYSVSSGGVLLCYHPDAMANILVTSDDRKFSTALYAYTPYGRSLGETNRDGGRLDGIAKNAYRFGGSQGVTEEVPNLYFMRARYYSAEAASFLSTDPLRPIGPGWKSAPYLYAEGNPLTFSDPTGEDSFYGDDLNNPRRAAETTDVWAWLSNKGWEVPGSHVVNFNPSAFSGSNPNRLNIVGTFVHENVHVAESFLGANQVYNALLRTKEVTAPWIWRNAMEVPSFVGQTVASTLSLPFDYKGSVNQLKNAWQNMGKVLTGSYYTKADIREDMARVVRQSKTVQAAGYANTRNIVQSVVPKLANAAVSIGASIVGDMAGKGVAKLLPKSTPPVVKAAVKTATSVVVAHVVKIVVFAIIGVPKGIIYALSLVLVAALFHLRPCGCHRERSIRQNRRKCWQI